VKRDAGSREPGAAWQGKSSAGKAAARAVARKFAMVDQREKFEKKLDISPELFGMIDALIP
jgi:hypothetical protein